METILLFQRADTFASRERLKGLNDFARGVGWAVQNFSASFDRESLGEILDFWRPAGIVASNSESPVQYDLSLLSPKKTVLIDTFPLRGAEAFRRVSSGDASVPDIAMRELLSLDCASYGFVPSRTFREWNAWRKSGFERICKVCGKTPNVFKPEADESGQHETGVKLARWISAMKRPVGIFAASDAAGAEVLDACRAARISVPFECSVVGVGNDELACMASVPSLSSIELDFRLAGFKAGECLLRLLEGLPDSGDIHQTPPRGIVRRGSSRKFAKLDRCALDATELVRAKACDGLTVHDVLSLFPCSRRMAETRFRAATGKSILSEIRSARIEKAKRLAADATRDLSSIASECGYASDTTFRRIFRESTGFTLGGWRRAAASSKDR